MRWFKMILKSQKTPKNYSENKNVEIENFNCHLTTF